MNALNGQNKTYIFMDLNNGKETIQNIPKEVTAEIIYYSNMNKVDALGFIQKQ